MLLDLQSRPLAPPDRGVLSALDWAEVARLWNENELGALHDWLNARWSRLIRNSPLGQSDPEAEFLQGLAYAVLALFFMQHRNQAGALLMLDDALVVLGKYRPQFLGVRVDPIVATLHELRPILVTLGPDDDFPCSPFVYARFETGPAQP